MYEKCIALLLLTKQTLCPYVDSEQIIQDNTWIAYENKTNNTSRNPHGHSPYKTNLSWQKKRKK